MTTQAAIPLKWYVPFATGDASRVEIPVTSSDATRASQTLGFPPLTMQPPAVGGVPPQGEDFNGAMNQVARVAWWVLNGGGWPYDATFATNSNINGYPNGAVLQSADFLGQWINTTDNNQINPDTVGTGWVPGFQYGSTSITGQTGGTTTLTPLQAAKRGITVSGTLASAQVIILPTWIKDWSITNNTTGAFTLIVKTLAGSGVTIPQNGSPTAVSGDGTNVNQPAMNIPAGTSSTHAAQVSQTTGRLLNIQVFTASGTYTNTAGTNSVIFEAQAGGGASGASVATSSTQNSIGAVGGAGTYAKARFTTGFTGGIAITIGAAGVAGSGNGGAGGTTSVGSLISCPGGTGGAVGTLTTTPVLTPGSAPAALATITGAAQVLANIAGDGGTYGSCLAPTSSTVIAGHGGNSPLGNGGRAGASATGLGFGGGGGGVAQGASGAAQNGLAGAAGVVIAYEYA